MSDSELHHLSINIFVHIAHTSVTVGALYTTTLIGIYSAAQPYDTAWLERNWSPTFSDNNGPQYFSNNKMSYGLTIRY